MDDLPQPGRRIPACDDSQGQRVPAGFNIDHIGRGLGYRAADLLDIILVDFRLPVGDSLFTASVDWAYHDEKNFFLYESREFRADSFELGARIGWVFPEARYEVNLFARNLTDEIVVQNGIDFNNLTGMTNEPRIIGLELVARF